MNTSSKLTIVKVWFPDDKITVLLSDGREVSCPLSWFPRLELASPQQRLDFELICGDTGIHWEGLDEDLSLEGFLTYSPKIYASV